MNWKLQNLINKYSRDFVSIEVFGEKTAPNIREAMRAAYALRDEEVYKLHTELLALEKAFRIKQETTIILKAESFGVLLFKRLGFFK